MKVYCKDFDFLKEHIPDASKFDTMEFFKQRLLSASRIFALYKDNGKRKEAGFVPYADMLNHEGTSKLNCRWRWDDAQQGFIMEAMLDIPRGE